MQKPIHDSRIKEATSSNTRSAPETERIRVQVCTICDGITDAVFGFLARMQYALSHNHQDQQEHALRGGFCAIHTWQYERLASPQGICTAYPGVLRALARQLHARAETQVGNAVPVPGPDHCAACLVALRTEDEGVQSVASMVVAEALPADAPLPDLCLAHLRQVVERIADGRAAARLLSHAASTLDQLADRMERFNRKREGALRVPITEEDWATPRRALALLVGHRNVRPSNDPASRASNRREQG